MSRAATAERMKSTLVANDLASATVSSKRQQYSAVTAGAGRL